MGVIRQYRFLCESMICFQVRIVVALYGTVTAFAQNRQDFGKFFGTLQLKITLLFLPDSHG